MRKLVILTVGLLIATPAIVLAVPEKKYLICKFVGQPGVNETLQTGQNPISVSGNAIAQPVVVGAYFTDQQGRSYVLVEDTGQPEPNVSQCPQPTVLTPPPTPTPTPTPTPVITETPRVQGAQSSPATQPDFTGFSGK